MTGPAEPGVASIDDLLGHDEDDAAAGRPRRRSAARQWLRAAAFVGAATAATVVGLRLAGVGVPVLLVFAAFAALRALHSLAAQVASPPPPRLTDRPSAAADDGLYHWQGGDALRAAVRQWETRLQWAHTDAARFSRNVLPVLADLADERLRQRHGVTRTSDPRRARELLGDPLWGMLAEPGRRPPKARELAAYITALEKL